MPFAKSVEKETLDRKLQESYDTLKKTIKTKKSSTKLKRIFGLIKSLSIGKKKGLDFKSCFLLSLFFREQNCSLFFLG